VSKTFGKPGRRLAVALFAFLLPVSVSAHDFGLHLNQLARFGGVGNDSGVDKYYAGIVPRFSAQVGDYGDLFLSAGFRTIYEGGWTFVPELLRNEFSRSFGDVDFRVGRMTHADPMRLVAAGLFDGVRFSRHTGTGTFGAGVWYTGLLYKNRALISMTDCDAASRREAFDWNRFGETYFASRRLMAALDWEHPSFAELMRLNVALIAQADLNSRNRDFRYHSQYIVATASVPFQRFVFEFGGALETSQSVSGGTVFNVALAGDVGLHWMPPAPFHNMLSFTGRFTSGRADGGPMSAFVPLTALPHGDVLRAEIPGLSILRLNYTARLYRTFSAGFSVSHFVRSDLGTFDAFPLTAGETSDGFSLGTEFFARFVWNPVSDIGMNFGAGVFLPALGNAAPDAGPRWRVDLTVVFALY